MGHAIYDPVLEGSPAWNVGRKLGAKRPLLPKQVWAVRFFLEQEHRLRDRGLCQSRSAKCFGAIKVGAFNLCKLRNGGAFDQLGREMHQDSFWVELNRHGRTQLMCEATFYHSGSKAPSTWPPDQWPAALPPQQLQDLATFARLKTPPDLHPSCWHRERPILQSIRGKFVQTERQGRCCLRAQHRVRAADLNLLRIRRKRKNCTLNNSLDVGATCFVQKTPVSCKPPFRFPPRLCENALIC